ncbi:Gfo/Idh/MocA family oxidoreductase, partial [Flavobacteriaceae bacterium]|nr:Gfo/Idh/MocA family oxidoreductase [Flavobacteriaceae bacterium]
MKILIYGFGRMGLTHFSILNGLNPDLDFSVIEPNKILRKILQKNINAKFYADDSSLKQAFDITLITTPPSIHLQLLEKSINRGDKKIFVEKPFGGYTNTNLNNIPESNSIHIGYVLRFNPCIQWVKTNINPLDIKSMHGQYLSNTIEKKPTGWRNGSFSGVLNEMGSHVIDLIQYIVGNDQMEVLSSKKESIVSDIDDIVEATLKTKNDISISMYFNWVKKDIRKPVFGIEIQMKDGYKYSIDQQQINKYSSTGDFIEKVAVTDLAKPVPFYLRGVDFTDQMLDLLGD